MSTPQLCPLCKSPNHCELIEAPDTPSTCWCMQLKIPQSVLASVSSDQANIACICKACALQMNSHNT